MGFDEAVLAVVDTPTTDVPPPPGPLLLSVDQAAERLGVGMTLMRALVSAGEIESVKIGRLRRIPADALSAHVTQLRERQGKLTTAKRPMKRVTNGRSAIYKGEDGYWHGRVSVGVRDDGRPDRRHVLGLTRAIIAENVATRCVPSTLPWRLA